MYHGYRRLVCSLVCVFSILFMLYLDTCTVEAGFNQVTTSVSGTFSCSADTCYFSYYTGATNLVTPNYYYINGGQHIELPFKIAVPTSSYPDVNINVNNYYMMILGNLQFNITGGTASNISLKNAQGDLMWVGAEDASANYWSNKQYFNHYNALNPDYNKFVFSGYLCFDFVFNKGVNGGDGTQYTTGNWSLSTVLHVEDVSSEQYSSGGQIVTDPVLNDNVVALQEDTATTAENTSGILSKVTEFFGSFFSNLIGVFVPEDGYFSEWFNKVNSLLSEKLGMLYAPFDLVISTLQAIYSADSTETGIPFPGIKWEDTWLVEPFTFTFASLGDSFDDLRDKVYFATDTVLVLTFLMLLQSKVKLILEGHE